MTEASPNDSPFPILTAVEARILGGLIEKEATTPEQYPLTDNAVVLACNQKSNRDPLMELDVGQVGHALRSLESRRLVRSQHGSRAQRWEHRLSEGYSITRQQQGLLATLLLRGAQTLNELHARSERLAKFADIDDLKHALDRLLQRDAPLVVRIPKAPGQREDRYMHLLCGPVDIAALSASVRSSSAEPARGANDERLAALEARVAAIEQALGLPGPE